MESYFEVKTYLSVLLSLLKDFLKKLIHMIKVVTDYLVNNRRDLCFFKTDFNLMGE
jgi:hypothetical protein